MNKTEPQQNVTTELQENHARPAPPSASERETEFAPAHESSSPEGQKASSPRPSPPKEEREKTSGPAVHGSNARQENIEAPHEPTQTHSARRRWIAGIIIAVLLIGGLVLGFLPRWRQRGTAIADMNQLAIPTVSVVSPTPGKPGSGLV